jgi:hypothetical protein
MHSVPQLHDPTLRRLADAVGDSPELVQHDLAEFPRLDLTDYGEDYPADRPDTQAVNGRRGPDYTPCRAAGQRQPVLSIFVCASSARLEGCLPKNRRLSH